MKYFWLQLVTLQSILASPIFRLYNTDVINNHESHYDCLDYYVLDNIVKDRQPSTKDQQIIPYCIRPLHKLVRRDKGSVSGTPLTFETLNKLKVDSQRLLQWSTPIDVVERYELYVSNNTMLSLNEVFYNCSHGWFGPTCEYTFFSDNSFEETVYNVFANKLLNMPSTLASLTNHTCYEHLNCKRGPTPICLDWREVCNGQIDCLGDGVDEQECFSLEENECTDGEYRCRNGQCIPESFLHDNDLNPDCLDKSDEKLSLRDSSLSDSGCILDPSFRCEETICTYAFDTVCGDGQCLSNNWQWSDLSTCNNRRKYLIDRAKLAYSENLHLSYICWSSMVCLLQITYYLEDVDCGLVCQYSLGLCIDLIRQHCPREFIFPLYPMIAGHVYFAYKNDQRINSKYSFEIPDFLCYDQYFCPFLSSSIIIENRTCQFYEDLDIYSTLDSRNIFQACLTDSSSKNKRRCEDPNLYECAGSYKCISKHRLVDGVIDCFQNDDEDFNNSCSLNHKHRFQCSSQPKKCISPVNVYDQMYNCPDYEDENNILTAIGNGKITFPMICDGFFDMEIFLSESNETDETHCEYWPCKNQYTRCDGVWHCANGGDELNCGPSLCPPDEHPCVSPITYNITCLSYNRSGDGKIDCLGATDERRNCREMAGFSRLDTFQCSNSSGCLSFPELCNGYADCPLGDDEQFCRNHTFHLGLHICDDIWKEYRTATEQFFCQKSIIKSPIVYFKLENSIVHSKRTISSISNRIFSTTNHYMTKRSINYGERISWLCNRGILMYRGKEEEEICLCPPSYYGSRCEYQSERVSITVQIRTGETRIVYEFLLILIDNTGEIHSVEHRSFLSMRDCRAKFNLNLLYNNRPKELNGKNYSVRIDMFDKVTLKYRSSWLFPLQFLFLPVQRLAVQLIVRENEFQPTHDCPLSCVHGICMKYINKMEYFCQCDENWSGLLCSIKRQCYCAADSLCVNFVNNRSICVCPIGKFGPYCRLNHSSCQNNPCKNGGSCIPTDERISEKNFTCICDANHSGSRCERTDSTIIISFSKDMPIPSSILVHFITILANAHPQHTTSLAKIAFDRDTAILYRSDPFHIAIVQILSFYYLTIVQNKHNSSVDISARVILSQRCASINELFNTSILGFASLRRVKYYHLPCQERSELSCFYDEIYICLCNSERHANCFEFNHKIEYNCQGLIYCANNASCYQNHPICPSTVICSCPECFYGTQCQSSTQTFVLSLDVILGYHIHPDVSFSRQTLAVKVSASVTIILTVIGIVSSILSIITFQVKSIQKSGCGLYLYISSMNSLVIMSILTLKFWLLVVCQMNLISNRTILSINCIMMEFLLKGFFSVSDWLSACVSIERVFSAVKGIKFDQHKSKRVAKLIIIIIYTSVLMSFIHDPIHRQLMDDKEDKRSWCVVNYSSSLLFFNSIINISHVIIPFSINLISAFTIIIVVTRQRSIAQKKLNYKQHLFEQLRRHKHLILTPFILVILILPRLIISFVSGCMKSAREPWLFLTGYFISFIPPLLTFFLFVLPSETFTKEFVKVMKRKWINIKRRRI